MPRVAGWWVVALVPFVITGGCQVDHRTVICDLTCEQGSDARGGSAGASSATGGSPATGGLSASGGSKATGGAAASGGKGTGGSMTGGASGVAAGGMRAEGGSAFTAGAASTGGNPTTGGDCKSSSVATGMNPLIDDFQDGDLSLSANEGRAGYWIHLRSDAPANTSPPLSVVSESSAKFMRISGLGIAALSGDYPWISIKTDLKATGSASAPGSCLYDASKYSGIQFRARGVQVRVSVEMDLDVPVSNDYGAPGACPTPEPQDCYDRHNIDFTLSGSWASYRLYWQDLAQLGYTDWHPMFDPRRLLGLYFEVIPDLMTGSISDYQIDVDDVEFIP